MKFIINTIIVSAFFVSLNTQAKCTLKTAQTKMLEVTNMMQVYNRKKLAYLEKSATLPADFEKKFDSFVEGSNQLSVKFGEETEAKPQISLDDPINQEVCDGYDNLFSDYAPEGYEKKAVKVLPTSAGANCDTNSLWDRYGKLIQKQAELTKAGAFSNAENSEMMLISTKIGEYSTTDLAKACANLDKLESIVNTK